MAKFVKKPVVIEAEQFFHDKPLPHRDRGPIVAYADGAWYVTTVHGQQTPIEDGDWIILEPRGQHAAYPCKPDIFEASYEPYDDGTLVVTPDLSDPRPEHD